MIRFDELNAIHVELSSACNASCPNCPRNVYGGYTVPGLKPKAMTILEFQTIFTANVLNQIKRILMCGNYGDPIYCADLPLILDYIKKTNSKIQIKIHTNGGVRNTNWWSSLANSYDKNNLEVVFSIDGLEDTNHIYRRGVVWKELISHLKAFIEAGGNATWEFLVFKHNEHQIIEAEKFSKYLGVSKILFKRPFGFETIHNGSEVMPVIDRSGNYEYSIYSAEKYRHNVMESGVVSLEKRFDLPIEKYQSDVAEVYNSKILDYEKKAMELHDDVKISCMTKNYKEIYIDSNGIVHPCCFLGVNYGVKLKSLDYVQYNEWLINNVDLDQINAFKHSLEEIMQNSYMFKIEKNWKQSHTEDRLMCCTRMCAVSKGIKNGLYA